ncbi:MAG: hypothetical protein GC160_19780 [Acidobacteria bacterium]|nr:hypothetical protein [Acidobacteriota bacterium]
MSKCCDSKPSSPLELLPSGLSSLPRQLAAFPEVRRQLLERLANPDDAARRQALGDWRPSGDDFGLMWLEMWAYVADVLGFYDERIANESYLGTAVRRPSLRRLVDVLGYTPASGVAATATVAAIAEGRLWTTLPPGTGFRSRGFDGQPPQVFETTAETAIHPLKNQWKVVPFQRRPTIDASNFEGDAGAEKKEGSNANRVNRLLFEPRGFGLAADELVLIDVHKPGDSDFAAQATRVTASEPFSGKDGKSYIRVSLDPPAVIEPDVDLSTLRARRPTQSAAVTANEPIGSGKSTEPPLENVSGGTRVYFDKPPTTFRLSDPIIVSRNFSGDEPAYRLVKITSVKAAAVRIASIPGATASDPSPAMPATELIVSPALPSTFQNPSELLFHHSFVLGGSPTNTGKVIITADELADPEGVPIDGTVELPLDSAGAASEAVSQTSATEQVLRQEFLLSDADEVGLLLDGELTVSKDGHAAFRAVAREQIDVAQLRLPLTLFGNVVEVSRGERVPAEVLGNGDARVANQKFKLKKKPLTYLQAASSDATAQSTLEIYVDGILWSSAKSFFGQGPNDKVYIVRHDDNQNAFVTFGDGVRGARLPSGVKNVVASYRFGAGAAAPPANHIKQLAAAVKGLRGVKSPVGAQPGKDADAPEALRENAPRTALLLGRAVSPADFEALASNAPGVIQARAQWLWIASQMQAGVVVHYIGDADEAALAETLRAQGDPSLPLSVDQAEPIATTASVSVEVDPRYVKDDVAEQVRQRLVEGVLNPAQASIGGTFWPGVIYEATGQVPGVVAVNGLSFTTDLPTLTLTDSDGRCIPTGRYLDFSADGAVGVTAVDAKGLPPLAKGAA